MRTLVELLRARAGSDPERIAYRFLADGEAESDAVSWRELERRARAIAAFLQSRCGRGERILLALPSGIDFIAAFFGAQLAGTIPVPAPLPQHRRGWPRLASTANDAQPALALTSGSGLPGPLARADLSEALGHDPEAWREVDLDGHDVAFLQYTSGSTSSPRGVMVTHENLLHNERMIREVFAQTAESVVVGWLPLHHDMGLIGNVLQPLYSGATAVLMPPAAFLQRPILWLKAISRYRATTSGGPDFGYDLCARRVRAEELETLDLSHWRVAFNGSEPIRLSTLERFSAVFEPCGFRAEAFHPCYGLAEATLLVSGKPPGASPATKDRTLVSSGIVADSLHAVIVDPNTHAQLPAGSVGEIWLAGPSVARGYWNRPDETSEVFQNALPGFPGERFLRTGDLGFFDGEELFVTGRLKDLVIIRGRNHYPQDIERTVEETVEEVVAGGGAAFAIDGQGGEQLVLVHEVQRTSMRSDLAGAIARIRAAVTETHDIQPQAVVLIRPGTLPRTTSGKVQRRACAQMFLRGELEVVASALPEASGSRPPLRRASLRRDLCALVAWFAKVEAHAVDASSPLTAFGVDSLAVLELKSAIETDLGVDVPLQEILEAASIGALAAAIDGAPILDQRASPWREGEALPLSEGQRSLWFMHQLAPRSTAYHVGFAVRAASLDPEAMERAWRQLSKRHDMLRSRFELRDGEPVRVVDPGGGAAVSRLDGRRWPDDELRARIDEEIARPFDLSRGPLLRVSLIERGHSWVIVLAAHHIIVDFWSLVVLLEELAVLYGNSGPLPPLRASYSDFVACESQLLRSEEGERLARRWEERLRDAPRVLDLPADFPRPAVQTWSGAKVDFSIPEEVARQLGELARAHRTTRFTVLLACFGELLSRYTGQSEVVVGSPVAGRTRAGMTDLVGYFANLVPLRLSPGGPSFADSLDRISPVVREALALQSCPFPRIVERLQPARDPSRSPLFQAVFALEKPHRLQQEGLAALTLGRAGGRISLGGLQLESLEIPRRAAQFDLTLMMIESGARLEGSFEYNTDLFLPGTIERLGRHFVTLLGSIARGDQPGLMDAGERHQVLVEWNGTARDYPRDRTLGELFREQVALRGDAVALEFGDERVSYRQLGERTAAMAARLREAGVGPEVTVAIESERSIDLVVSIIAVIEAGGAYVPLDPSWPEERRRHVLEDSGARVVSTSGPPSGEEPKGGAEARTTPQSLAYVIYTSGSTGKPKGVMVEHRPIVRLVKNNPYVQLGPETVMLQYAPATFDASTFEIWGALLNGARLVIAPPGRRSLQELGEVIRGRGINTLWLTAGLFHLMVDERIDDLRGVRQLLAGGEALSADHVKRLLDRAPGVTVINGYGPTEGTTFTCCRRVEAGEELGDTVPIGRAIANTKTYVLDPHGQPVPAGMAGELYIGGDGLARGYVNAPELTAQRFVTTPYGRLYRTGDRVRWTSRGELEFLGRFDGQLKVRGFRVEPGEIESVLRDHPDVGDAVVVGRRRDAGDTVTLIGYVTGREGELSASSLREYLRSRLPDFMVPSQIVVLDALPLTANGKVDRNALPEPEATPARHGAEVAPRNDLEDLIASICREVLGVDSLSIHDNFFDLGCHSLLIARIHARLQPRLDREVTIIDFFSHPTVAALAAFLTAAPEQNAFVNTHQRAAARRQSWTGKRRSQMRGGTSS